MKQKFVGVLAATLWFGVLAPARAQMGMDLFRKPSITKVFNPVVGQGSQYAMSSATTKGDQSRIMEIGIVGKESVDGEEAYWMEFVHTEDKGQPLVGKTLLTKGSFRFQRMIMQMPGRPAMEMPYNPNDPHRAKMDESMNDWHSVGTETITVPAGTFACEHWKNDKTNGNIWTSDKVVPFGLVKQVDENGSMVLTKQLRDFPDRITGPVQKFDPQTLMQQMQEQHGQQPPIRP